MNQRNAFLCTLLCGLGLLGVFCNTARAQLPQPRLDQILPLGGEAGSLVVLDITGRDLDEATRLRFDHPGIKSELIKPNQFRIYIASDVRPGTYEVRAIGKHGISGSRLFAVCHGLTEVAKVPANEDREHAQRVPMNAAINGASRANGEDFYRFSARQGQRITIDCQAFRLDSLLQAVLTVLAADGTVLARGRPYYERTDPLIDFQAPAGGDYLVVVHDRTFNGDLPYRLTLSDRPHVENAFPPVVAPGQQVSLTLLGRNLPGGKPNPQAVVEGQVLDELRLPFREGAETTASAFSRTDWKSVRAWPDSLEIRPTEMGALISAGLLSAPEEPERSRRLAFIRHPASAALNLRGFQFWPPEVAQALSPVTLVYASAPVTLEREPNDTAATAQQITLPAVVCGRFDRPGDQDYYRFTAKANEVVAVDLMCERLGMPGDPVVVVRNAKGEDLATLDDHGNNVDALSQFNRDPLGTFTIPADGEYQLLVQERYRRGGPRYLYALRVGKPQPDFYPVVFHETQVDPTCPVVRQGGSALFDFCLNRRDGFAGEITVEAEGLPRGMSCPAVHVGPNQEFASIVFTAAGDAPAWAGPVRLNAWAMIAGKRVERPVGCVQRRWGEGSINSASRACREICLAVRSRAPYGLTIPTPQLTIQAGKSAEFHIKAVRYWPDFKDKIQLTPWKAPPGFEVGGVEIATAKNEAAVKVTVAAEVPPGTYTLVVRGDAQVPYSADPKAVDKPKVRVADPATPVTVVVSAPAAK